MKLQMRTRRGMTLTETMVGATIGLFATFGAVMMLVFGMSAWVQGEGRISAETQAQSGLRAISQRLREAMMVSVDANGLGLTYRLPLKSGGGNYIVPAQWDGVARRIELNGTELRLNDGGTMRTICQGVSLRDPLSSGGLGSYRIFTPGTGTITRQITVQLVKQTYGDRNRAVTSRRRETIFLRNIPELKN